jgi:hypothetical protein
VKDVILAVFSLHQGLGVVFESVRWRLSALVAHIQKLAVLNQHKISVGASRVDASRLHIPGNPQMPFVSIIPHRAQILDLNVIALALLDPDVGHAA